MKLTPIKGRGKGPRKSGFKQPNPKRQKLSGDDNNSEDSVSKKASAATIEKLPKEILEPIMLFAKEPNFPRASLRIGWLLSDHSFLAKVVLQAFEPTWDLWLGCQKFQVQSYTGWFDDTERFGGDPELQSKVVALPFMTIDLIMDAQQRWIVKNGRNLYYQHSGDYNSTEYDPYDEWEDDERHGLNNGVTSHEGIPHRVKGLGHMKSAAACFNEEWEVTCFGGFYPQAFGGEDAMRLEVHPAIRIPDRLITGPLTKKDLELFYWLVHSGALRKEDQTWEIGLQGVRNLFAQESAEIANIGTLLLYAAGGFKNIPHGIPPISIVQVAEKLFSDRNRGSSCHRGCSWGCVTDRLFDLVGMRGVLDAATNGL